MRIAVDTNVLVRFLTWDDSVQAEAARAVMESGAVIVVPMIVVCELAWVLKRAYRYDDTDVARSIRGLAASRLVEIDRPAIDRGLQLLSVGGDFADGVIQHEATRAKCDRTVTFDREFARLSPDSVTLLGGALA